MSTLSELLPAGGGGATADFVASGTLPNGSPVILKSDGTVVAVAQSGGGSANIPSSPEIVFSTSIRDSAIAFDPNTADKFVAVYQDYSNSQNSTAVVGTVSGSTITFGTPVVFESSQTGAQFDVAFDPNTANKFVIVCRISLGLAIVGTVSGTSLSFATPVAFNSVTTQAPSISFDPNNSGKFVIAYVDTGGSGKGEAIVGTLSGTSLSFSTSLAFNTGNNADDTVVAFDPNTANSFVIAYKDTAGDGTAIVGTVSGTSLSFGTAVIFNSGSSSAGISIAFEPNTANRFIISYTAQNNNGYGTVSVGTVSGTSVSFATKVVFNSATSVRTGIAFDPAGSNSFVVSYGDNGNSSANTVILGTLSGTTASFGSSFVMNAGLTFAYSPVSFNAGTAGQFILVYRDAANSSKGTVRLGQLAVANTNLTATNFIGIATESTSSGDTATISVQGGLSTNQTGLTIGATYYVQPAGTLATSAGTPSVEAGKALSATNLLIKDL